MPSLRYLRLTAAIGLAIAAAWLLWLNRYGSLPPFTDAAGRPVAGSISETVQLELGGYTQWVTLRGPSSDAPILIWLSGGPGLDESFMLRRFNGVVEYRFLTAYWVQRGVGRSYDASLQPASLRIDQFVRDLDDLVGYLNRRFGQRRVVLVGHSWGTVIGVEYVAAHPDKVAAYVGIGQVTDMADSDRLGYAFALGEAKRRGDARAVADLERIGPPPYTVEAMLTQRGYVAALGGSFHQPISMAQMVWWSLETSRGAWLDLLKYMPGEQLSLRQIWPELSRVEISRTRLALGAPVAIFAGRHDRQTSAELAYRYFQNLSAPAKRFVWFENSAHSPPFEEPERFNAALLETIEQLVGAAGP